MVTLHYVFQDLARRKKPNSLIFLCISINVASMVFLTLLGFSIRLNLADLLHMSAGLNFVIAQFPIVAIIGCLVTGVVVLVNTTTTTITQRRRDIVILKSIGLLDEVETFFLIEAFIVTGIGCIFGGTSGLIAYYGLLTIIPTLSVVLSAFWLFLGFLVVIVVGFFVFFLCIYYPMYGIITLKGIIDLSGANTSWLVTYLGRRRLNWIVKIPLKAIIFHKQETLRVLGSIVFCSTIIAFSIFGSQIIILSTEHYVHQAIGQNTYLIATHDVAERYLAQLDFQDTLTKDFNYVSSEYQIDPALIAWLEAHPSIQRVDSRIITETMVSEVKFVEPIPPNDYRVVGGDRAVPAVVMGIHSEYVNDWIHIGQLDMRSGNEVWIGDSMLEILVDYQYEKLMIINDSFSISAVCLDPVNQGYTVYMPYASLSELLDGVDSNMVLIKINTVDSSIQQKVQEHGLTLVDLSLVLENYSRFLQDVQSTLISIPVLMTVSLSIALGSYFTTIILGMRSDYNIMYAIGLTWSKIKTMILIKSVLLIVPWFILGIILGLYLSSNVLIPFPQLPSPTTMYTNVLILGSIPTLMVLGSAFLSLKLLAPVYTK